MALSYEQAVTAVTGPGQPFETERLTIRGVPYTIFRSAPSSLREIFDRARSRPDDIFLVYEDERWTFGQVMEHVDALGALLVERYGVAPGDRVAIGMRNYPEWIVAFAAITSIGAISVSLNAWWTAEELDYGLVDSGTKVLIADHERVERSGAVTQREGIRVLAVRCPDEADLSAGTDRWEEVLPLGQPLPEVPIDPDDDATILYTSGTTGRPKGAVSTHRAVAQALMGFACRSAIDRARRSHDEAQAGSGDVAAASYPPVFILIVPLFHVTGSVPVMLSCFANGLKLVIMYRWGADRALELIERERVTNFVGVPTQSWDLLESPRFSEFDTSSLRSVGGGGAAAPPELVRRLEASFSRGQPSIGYGMTETNAYGPGNAGDDYVARPTSSGRVTPILEVEVRDPEGRPLPMGEQGEICFRGPNLIRGYWNRPEETAETFVEGWLRTGDIGRIDTEGFVYVEDRAKDMILRGGENVYCTEVEAVIYEHPGVYEAAVFGVPDERLGEEVAAAVHPRAGHRLTVEDLQSFVGQRLAAFKVPQVVVLRESALPRNAAGKILKRTLRDEWESSGSGSANVGT